MIVSPVPQTPLTQQIRVCVCVFVMLQTEGAGIWVSVSSLARCPLPGVIHADTVGVGSWGRPGGACWVTNTGHETENIVNAAV